MVLLYGCQTWNITRTVSNQLKTFINDCLESILGQKGLPAKNFGEGVELEWNYRYEKMRLD